MIQVTPEPVLPPSLRCDRKGRPVYDYQTAFDLGLVYVRETGRGKATIRRISVPDHVRDRHDGSLPLPATVFPVSVRPWPGRRALVDDQDRVFHLLSQAVSYVTRCLGSPDHAQKYFRWPESTKKVALFG